jgi:hypothetical protein
MELKQVDVTTFQQHRSDLEDVPRHLIAPGHNLHFANKTKKLRINKRNQQIAIKNVRAA